MCIRDSLGVQLVNGSNLFLILFPTVLLAGKLPRVQQFGVVVVEADRVEVHVFYSVVLQDALLSNQLTQIQIV